MERGRKVQFPQLGRGELWDVGHRGPLQTLDPGRLQEPEGPHQGQGNPWSQWNQDEEIPRQHVPLYEQGGKVHLQDLIFN